MSQNCHGRGFWFALGLPHGECYHVDAKRGCKATEVDNSDAIDVHADTCAVLTRWSDQACGGRLKQKQPLSAAPLRRASDNEPQAQEGPKIRATRTLSNHFLPFRPKNLIISLFNQHLSFLLTFPPRIDICLDHFPPFWPNNLTFF